MSLEAWAFYGIGALLVWGLAFDKSDGRAAVHDVWTGLAALIVAVFWPVIGALWLLWQMFRKQPE